MLKLSIIIPVYNVESYLRACLDSVIVPELSGYEIIAVDDGSTDASPQILAEYAARYPQLLRSLCTENGGLGHARNQGIPLAGGEYLMFVDSDDTLREGALAEILPLLDGSFDLLIFDLVSVNANGRILSYSQGCAREGSFDLNAYPELLFDPANACNKIWRRSLFSETGLRFPDLQRSGSITNSKAPQRNLEMLTVIHSVLEHYRQAGCYERYKDQLEYMAFYHELLTSSTRVNLLEPDSPIQDALLEDFLAQFPDFQSLLSFLILHRQHRLLHAVMRLNRRLRNQDE